MRPVHKVSLTISTLIGLSVLLLATPWVIFVRGEPSPDSAGFSSDDFNACSLDEGAGGWTFTDPVGVSTHGLVGAGSGEAWLEIAVPAGVVNNPWNNYNAPRVMRPIANVDFELEVKFLSALTTGHQMQGIFIEQDAGNYLRFDFHHNGTGMRVFAASTTNGSSQSRYNSGIAAGVPQYMRVRRQGNQWTQSYSYDGTTWTTAAVFARTLTAAQAGVFAGTYGNPAPAHTARFDYAFSTATPVVPEDGGTAETFTLTTGVSGGGMVQRTPDQASYACGTSVTLTAVPAAGWTFTGWGGDLAGTQNPATLVMDAARIVEAAFSQAPAPTPPVISNIQVVPTHNSATVTWTTDQPATSAVAYGPTSAYESGAVTSGTLVTNHSMVLPGLAAEAVYHYQVTSTSNGLSASSGDLTFVTAAAPGDLSGFVSDDFNACSLDEGAGGWTFADPVGVSTYGLVGAGSGEAWLEIAVPAGVVNNPWNNYNAPRVMRPIANVDFELEVKFLSALTTGQQMQGIFIEQDAANYLRFDFHHNGTGMRIFAASTTNGKSQSKYNVSIVPGVPQYMRVRRQGNQWTQSYSYDGTTWTTAAVFARTLTATRAGVFAGNYGSPAPAHTARFDYAFSTATPVVPEDGGSVGSFTLTTGVLGSGTVERNPDQASYACGTSVTLTAVPVAGWTFTGWSGDLAGTQNPATLTVTRSKDVTAQFVVNTPPQISSLSVVRGDTWGTVSWQTNEPATSTLKYGMTAEYELGSRTDSALSFQHSITLTGLTPETLYHVQAVSLDSEEASTESPDSTFTTTSIFPLQITNPAAVGVDTSATITWMTNKPATSSVSYGTTTAYEFGSVTASTLTFDHTLSLDSLSSGTTYHYRIASTDEGGQTSFSSDLTFTTTSKFPIIDVWYGDNQRFGHLGVPQSWINILGNAHDPDGIASLRYSLNNGAWRSLSIGPDSRRLASPGDFNIEVAYAEVLQGSNSVRMSAFDDVGNETQRTVWFDVMLGTVWTPHYSVDWGSVTHVQDAAQVVDGLWGLESDGVRPLVMDYDRLIAIGDVTWSNYEITASVKVQQVDPGGFASPSNGPAVGIGMRWKGHTANGSQPSNDFWPAGAFAWYRWNAGGPERFELRGNRYNRADYDNSGRRLDLGRTYVFKVRVQTQTDGQHLYQFKVWIDGDLEPSAWDLEIRNGNLADDPTHGSILLIAHHVDATFGDIVITPVW